MCLQPHLGEFSERLFTDPAAEEAIARFQDKLNKVSEEIVERNSKLEFQFLTSTCFQRTYQTVSPSNRILVCRIAMCKSVSTKNCDVPMIYFRYSVTFLKVMIIYLIIK